MNLDRSHLHQRDQSLCIINEDEGLSVSAARHLDSMDARRHAFTGVPLKKALASRAPRAAHQADGTITGMGQELRGYGGVVARKLELGDTPIGP